jgi:succinate-acetate transporter protein
MTTTANEGVTTQPVAPAPVSPFFAGNPAIMGVPTFTCASIVLGLNLVGFTPVSSAGTPLPIIILTAGLGQMIATIWALALGQTIIAGIFGIFGGFWLSYPLLVLGLVHNWFGVANEDVVNTQEAFLIAWLVIILLLTFGTLRLPLAFSLIFIAVDLALASVLTGVLTGAVGWINLGGAFAFVFAALGAWVYLGVLMESTGGTNVPLGRPIISS